MATYSLSDYVWGGWNSASTTYSTTSSTTSDHIYKLWCSSTTSASTSTDQVWYTWVSNPYEHSAQPVIEQTWQTWNQQYVYQPTPEQSQAMQEAVERQNRMMREQGEIIARQQKTFAKKKNDQEETAKRMLLDIIGEDLRAEYERTGQIYVKGKKHGYIVKKYGHVKRIENDGKIREFCVHLRDSHKYPETDNVIALLMSLKYSEEETLRIANDKGDRFLQNYSKEQLEAAGMPDHIRVALAKGRIGSGNRPQNLNAHL